MVCTSAELFPESHIESILGYICAEMVNLVKNCGLPDPRNLLTHLEVVKSRAGCRQEPIKNEQIVNRRGDERVFIEERRNLG
jgi:hypothetical protein